MRWVDVLIGEVIGTFVLVFLGCGSVAVSILFGWLNLTGVAICWGIAVGLGILASRKRSGAHLNPAVTLGFAVYGQTEWRELGEYWAGQLLGAVAAAASLYFLLSQEIVNYEVVQGIRRGERISVVSAAMFGEYFPNPTMRAVGPMSLQSAALWELLGTTLLMFGILFATLPRLVHRHVTPWIIGLVVTLIILLVAPYTQAGINPARDFGPRLVSAMAGWKDIAFSYNGQGWWLVYILAPLAGAAGIAGVFRIIRYGLSGN